MTREAVDPMRRFRSRSVVRNVAASLGTQLVSWLVTFAVTLYLPRYLGDTGLGRLALAMSFASIFSVVVNLGTGGVMVREIARDRSQSSRLLAAAIILRIPTSILMTGFAALIARAFGYPEVTRTLIIIAVLGTLVTGANDAFASVFQGQEDMPRRSIAILLEKVVSSGLTMGLIFQRAPLWTFAAVGLVSGAVSILVNLSVLRSIVRSWHYPTVATLRSLALAGLPFMGCYIFRALYGQTDPIVLNLVAGDAAVGWYAAAFRLCGASLFIPLAIVGALFPVLSRLRQDDMPGYCRIVQQALKLVMFCGMPIAMLLICIPESLIRLLHYPASFNHSIPVLRIGGVGILVYFAASVLGTAVTAADGQTGMFRASIFAVILGVPACFLCSYLTLLLWGNGAVGATTSDVLLEAFLLDRYRRLLPAGGITADSVRSVVRAFVAAIPMAGLLTLAQWNGVGLWAIVPAGLVYLVCCWLLGCFCEGDLLRIKESFAIRSAC